MSSRAQAVKAWADYCRRFGHDRPHRFLRMTCPGFERYPVDVEMVKAIAADLCASPDPNTAT